jgi:hypothetical protein
VSTDRTSPSPDPSAPLRKNRLRLALQVAGFAIGIAILVWVVRTALAEMTPERWGQLRGAHWSIIAGMLALGVASLVFNGLLWLVAFLPIRRLRAADTLAVNAAATLLAYAPFKLSFVFRVLYHRRFDAVPVLQFGGWSAAVVATLAAAITVGLIASLTPLRDRPGLWLAVTLLGALACGVAGSRVSAFFATGAGWRWLTRTAGKLGGARGTRVVESPLFENLHSGVHMLAATPVTLTCVAMRLLDAGTLAGRFLLAAHVLGVELSLTDALVIGVAYFVIGAAAPTGTIGVREGGTAGLFALLDVEGAAPVIVFVSAVEMLSNLAGGLIAAGWLGPAKLLRLSHDSAETATTTAADTPSEGEPDPPTSPGSAPADR